MCERIKSGSRRGGDWHALCIVMPPDTGREELRLANRRWQGIPQGEWDPRSSERPREGRAPPSARGLPDLHRR